MCCIWQGSQAMAQSLQIKTTGESTATSLSALRKITFPEDQMVLFLTNGTTQEYAQNTINRMWFERSFSATETLSLASAQALSIYPNPAEETVWIQGLESASYKILQINGKLLKTGNYHSSEGLSVGFLDSGLYLVELNGETLKLWKR